MKYLCYLLVPIAVIVILVNGSLGFADPVGSDGNPSHSTAVKDLPQLVGTEEGIQHLYEEFANIKGGQRMPWDEAIKPENIKKNRYQDELMAFDHSRVILTDKPDEPNSDYINANYMDGQNSEREYVATQGPLDNTVNDFWRMIWQLNATKIIMLANVYEHGKKKVEKYWPDVTATYGDFEVTKLAEFSIPRLQHVVRTFSVKKEGIRKPRILRHFHFTGWPDFGVPQDRFSLVSLIHQARLYRPKSKAPIVVHCSAGIGRTGTVILTDSMMQMAEQTGYVDFPKRLDHMRRLRPDVVEKKEQYVFAYQAVNDVYNDVLNVTKGKLEALEEEYRHKDLHVRQEDLSASDDYQEVLQKMSYHNTMLRIMITNLMAQHKLKQSKAQGEAVPGG